MKKEICKEDLKDMNEMNIGIVTNAILNLGTNMRTYLTYIIVKIANFGNVLLVAN